MLLLVAAALPRHADGQGRPPVEALRRFARVFGLLENEATAVGRLRILELHAGEFAAIAADAGRAERTIALSRASGKEVAEVANLRVIRRIAESGATNRLEVLAHLPAVRSPYDPLRFVSVPRDPWREAERRLMLAGEIAPSYILSEEVVLRTSGKAFEAAVLAEKARLAHDVNRTLDIAARRALDRLSPGASDKAIREALVKELQALGSGPGVEYSVDLMKLELVIKPPRRGRVAVADITIPVGKGVRWAGIIIGSCEAAIRSLKTEIAARDVKPDTAARKVKPDAAARRARYLRSECYGTLSDRYFPSKALQRDSTRRSR